MAPENVIAPVDRRQPHRRRHPDRPARHMARQRTDHLQLPVAECNEEGEECANIRGATSRHLHAARRRHRLHACRSWSAPATPTAAPAPPPTQAKSWGTPGRPPAPKARRSTAPPRSANGLRRQRDLVGFAAAELLLPVGALQHGRRKLHRDRRRHQTQLHGRERRRRLDPAREGHGEQHARQRRRALAPGDRLRGRRSETSNGDRNRAGNRPLSARALDEREPRRTEPSSPRSTDPGEELSSTRR